LRSYGIYNKNRLLSEYGGAYGVKTGYTNKAGYCFVGSAQRDGLRLISVVLASGWGAGGREQKWIDTKRVLNYGFGEFRHEDVVCGGEVMGDVKVTRSREDSVGVKYAHGLRLPLTEDEKADMRVEVRLPDSIRAPITEGDVIGEADVIINGGLYATIDILAVGSAERHDFKTSLEKVLKAFLGLGTVNDVGLTLPDF
jgi:D-alanyl-D-alanine carboxypeptidase (penicillin-binding protein 5/6)